MRLKSYLSLAICATLITACGGKQGGLSNGDNQYPVRTIEAGSASSQTTYPATIKGIQDVEVRPKVSGFITKVFVQEGQHVGAGQVLFTIDSETYRAAVQQAQAAVNTARAQLSTAKLTYENSKKLFEKNIIGQFELSNATNSYSTAQATLAQAQAALASARENLSFCSVKSPAAGVVGSLPYKVGALVGPSITTALTTVSDISTAEVFFSVSEATFMNMAKTSGSTQAAIASFPAVKLQLTDGTIYDQPGRVVKASGVVDATTGSISLIAHFSNPKHLLKSGGAGKIVIPSTYNSAIVIPQECVSEVQDKKFVYVVGKDNKVKYTEITVADQNDGLNYVVTKGLNVGDRIVMKGISALSEGMQITPITEQQYEENIKKAAELAKSQGSAKDFANAMQGK